MADLPGLVKSGKEPAPDLGDVAPKVLLEAVRHIFADALELVDDSDEGVEAVA